MCLRGASAVSQMLERHPRDPMRVFLVWSAVRNQDKKGLPDGTLDRVPDPRVTQFWDRKLDLSKKIVRDVTKNPTAYELDDPIDSKTIVWDFAAVFPPGVRWEKAFPVPAYYGKPVMAVIRDVEVHVAKTQ
jgi:hypothetical protein